MKTTDPKKETNEQAETEQENYPENGAESLTENETDSSDLETEPPDDEDDAL